jgi:hypothetical protein
MKQWRALKYVGLTAILVMTSCGVSQKSLDNAQKKIDDLLAKGVPDSTLSPAKVFLYGAKDAVAKSESNTARMNYDSMKYYLAQAEAVYTERISKLQPSIDSLKSIIISTKTSLSGLQLKTADSMLNKVDSFVNANQFLGAFNMGQELVTRLPQLKFDEDRSKELRERIPGQWVCTNVTKGQEIKEINAVEKKIFDFGKDGKAKLIESKKGQSGPFLKEDWEFDSWGTYDFAGDTIKLFINRFAAVRQNFDKLYIEGKKRTWKSEAQPVYDSAITDGSQDRFVTFTDLKEDFQQVKKY